MCLTNSRNFYAPVNFVKRYGCLKLIHFSKKSGRLSSTGSEILAFGSQCSVNFQPILDCFIPKCKLKYDDLENMKTDRVNTVVFNLHEIKQLKSFFGTPGVLCNPVRETVCKRSLPIRQSPHPSVSPSVSL